MVVSLGRIRIIVCERRRRGAALRARANPPACFVTNAQRSDGSCTAAHACGVSADAARARPRPLSVSTFYTIRRDVKHTAVTTTTTTTTTTITTKRYTYFLQRYDTVISIRNENEYRNHRASSEENRRQENRGYG